jgi:hypothetical protein
MGPPPSGKSEPCRNRVEPRFERKSKRPPNAIARTRRTRTTRQSARASGECMPRARVRAAAVRSGCPTPGSLGCPILLRCGAASSARAQRRALPRIGRPLAGGVRHPLAGAPRVDETAYAVGGTGTTRVDARHSSSAMRPPAICKNEVDAGHSSTAMRPSAICKNEVAPGQLERRDGAVRSRAARCAARHLQERGWHRGPRAPRCGLPSARTNSADIKSSPPGRAIPNAIARTRRTRTTRRSAV